MDEQLNQDWDAEPMTPSESRRLTRRRFLARAGTAMALATGGVALDAVLGEPNRLEVIHREVPIRDLPEPFHGFRIGLLADFHFGNSMPVEFANGALRLAAKEGADVIALCGDFMQKGFESEVFMFMEALNGVEPPFGMFGVYGNHDHWGSTDLLHRVIKKDGRLRILMNEGERLMRNGAHLHLVGTDDLRTGVYRPDLALEGVDDGAPVIMLQHNPDSAEELDAGWRVDLALSGHMHGGQIGPLAWVPGVLPSQYGLKFAHGLVQGKGHRVYVTRGVGGQKMGRPRIWCRPEVTLITLVDAGNAPA